MKFLRYLNRRLALYCQNGNTLLVQVSLSSSYVHIRVSLVFKKNIKFCSDMFTPGGMDSQPHFLGIWIGYIQYIVYSIWVLHTYRGPYCAKKYSCPTYYSQLQCRMSNSGGEFADVGIHTHSSSCCFLQELASRIFLVLTAQ